MASSALIDDLLKQFAENPRRVFARLANEYRKRGELDTAIEICRAHVPLQPTYISGYIVLGQALYETGQLDEARSTFETALGLDPENLIGLRQLGDIARAKGDPSGARGWYRRLLEVDPQNDEVEAVLREIDAPVAAAPVTQEAVSWNDINPEATAAPAPTATPPAAASEPPASKSLDFDYDVLSAFGEAESKSAEQPASGFAGHEEPAPAASKPDAVHAAPAPVVIPAPAPIEHRESASDEPLPAAFITETMAELYLQQGHREQALDIYRLLLAQRPTDVSLLDRIARLQQAAPAAPVERTVRAFFGRFANRRPPGAHAESAPAGQAEPMAPEVPAPEEPAPVAHAEAEPPPLAPEAPVAREASSPLGHEPRAETVEVEEPAPPPLPAPEPVALETADTWTMESGAGHDVVAHDEPAAPASEPEPMAESAPVADVAPTAEAAPVFEEPSIADFAPAEMQAESLTEPEPEAAAPAPAPNEPLATPPHVESVGVGDYTPEHGRSMSFAELFAGREASPADEQAAAALASAYGTDAGLTNGAGNPTRAAADALSLDDVFGGGAHERESTPVTFDEFFSSQNAPRSEPAPESGTDQGSAPPAAARRADDADLELFHQWLEGLKK
ncbi:MAG TPA: tetratricopeptide repeat protein [Gemmatimonadaceae bacterium]|nr:tetratricopeptide repeat protein [Gemmatimonadaceae bacterium]